jgi:hypothetical protein
MYRQLPRSDRPSSSVACLLHQTKQATENDGLSYCHYRIPAYEYNLPAASWSRRNE